MSGGKASGKQRRDTAAEDALLQLQALHDTHREATRLFLMAARQGATDAQIAHALRQGLPHLTDPASLEDSRAGKQAEGTGRTEEGRQPVQKKRRQATETQPALLAPDAFAAALGAIPAEDWCRTWAAGRTIMLRSTSKRVKEQVDKMQNGLQGCWRSAQRWRTLISAGIQRSEQPGRRGLQECWDSAGSWCTSISVTITF